MRQESFSRLWNGYESDQQAKQARDKRWKELKGQGMTVNRWVLKGQMKQYDGLGQYNGSICDVYMLNIFD